VALKIIAGLALGFLIGAVCRWVDIPVPSPPTIIGALLVVSITIGYVTMDRYLGGRAAETVPVVHSDPANDSSN